MHDTLNTENEPTKSKLDVDNSNGQHHQQTQKTTNGSSARGGIGGDGIAMETEKKLPKNNNVAGSTDDEDDGEIKEGSSSPPPPKKSKTPNGAGNGNKQQPAADEEKNGTSSATTTGEASAGADSKSAKGTDKEKSKSGKSDKKNKGAAAAAGKADDKAGAAANPPPPVMKGTLSYDLEARRHLIRGMWNYENSNVFPPQRFELLRNLAPDEDPKVLPKDGEFHGSFSLAYFHTTSKGKQKERSKVIPESGVQIKFTKDDTGVYKVDGKGTNQFGIFHINGTATPSDNDADPALTIELRKRYEPSAPPPETAKAAKSSKADGKKATKVIDSPAVEETGPLPAPSKSFDSAVVCLRGKLFKETSNDLGVTEVVHRINGLWASGLNVLEADPGNEKGQSNRFEYEHKSSVPSNTFPVSGRYSGWFDLNNDDGSRTRINERDVTLKFKKNNAGYQNVEGKGSNVFGRYNITGTLTSENVITIFRHFQPRKLKAKGPVTPVPPPINPGAAGGQPKRAAAAPPQPEEELQLSLDDVKVPPEVEKGSPIDTIVPPAHSTYSAVSRGVLKMNDDGSHSCGGKWAVTREHFTNGQTSNFSFRLESHFAADAMQNGESSNNRQFPLDSPRYKGSFQLRKQGARYQTIVDQQVVMKFCMNSAGSYNVYGRGVNAIGVFNLIGTMVMSGKTGGQVELYRMYPPELLNSTPASGKTASATGTTAGAQSATAGKEADAARPSAAPMPGPPPSSGVQRRESTRLVKLPSKLEDDDPTALLTRTLQKCGQILRIMREKDVELGAFFSEPVDPVALGIPTYHQVIKEPMDLRTINRKMESGAIDRPDEFARLTRLVFQNAMTFNVDPAHSVHQAARSLLVMFNQKFRDVERMIENLKTVQAKDDKGKKKGKDDKKRKREPEEPPKSLKRIRLEEAQQMASSNATAVAAIVAAAPAAGATGVSRAEFNLLFNLIQQLQNQVVKTHTALAELSPGDDNDAAAAAAAVSSATTTTAPSSKSKSAPAQAAPAPAPERKKPAKRKPVAEPVVEEPAPTVDDSKPLTLEEQETLTETINDLPPEQLGGVIQIIREAAPVGADEDEIDLEIDQLDTRTQRKLLRHVSKFIKKSKAKAKKKPKTSAPTAKKAEAPAPAPKAKPKPAPKPKQTTDSFFAFGGKGDDSDSDSEDEQPPKPAAPVAPEEKTIPKKKDEKADESKKAAEADSSKSEFKLGGGLDDDDDNSEDDDDDMGGGLAANWGAVAKPAAETAKDNDDDDDDAWGAAREHAATSKVREAERKAREEKLKAEADEAKKKSLAEAVAKGEELQAQRAQEEEKEAQKKEQKKKEADKEREKAREAAREQARSVEQTVDLDAQRDLMKQYEQSFLDQDAGSASPSSDFGF